MNKEAMGDSEIDVRPAICVRHPPSRQENQEIFFCFDCNRVFCTYCQLFDDNRTNHKQHCTIKIKELTRIRKERIAKIRQQLKECIIKHDSTINETNKGIDKKQDQIQLLNDVIDNLAHRLHQEIDDLKVKAKDMIKIKASLIWDKSSISSIQQIAEETLANIREVRASLEYEIRRCEMDELAMAERSREMDALSDQLAAFLKSKIQLPAPAAFDLTGLRNQLQESIEQLECEVSRSKDAFIRKLDSFILVPNSESVRLVEQQAVLTQNLVLPSDQNQCPWITGVAQEENSDIVYITDSNNSSEIKSLDLKTHRIAKMSFKLFIKEGHFSYYI